MVSQLDYFLIAGRVDGVEMSKRRCQAVPYFQEIELISLGNDWAGGEEMGKHRASNVGGLWGLQCAGGDLCGQLNTLAVLKSAEKEKGSFQQLLHAVKCLHDCGRMYTATSFWLAD